MALSIEVAATYYELIEQALLLDLLQHQITADTTTRDLVKLRFANGAVSSTDVLQQEELLASVNAQLPPIQARLAVLRNRLHVLLGRAGSMPDSKALPLAEALPELPPLPALGIPADLLLNRPDLRKLRQEVAAADYRVAEAVAERLPTLKLGGSAGLSSGDFLLSSLPRPWPLSWIGIRKKTRWSAKRPRSRKKWLPGLRPILRLLKRWKTACVKNRSRANCSWPLRNSFGWQNPFLSRPAIAICTG